MPVTVRLEGRDGGVLAEARIDVSGRAWTKYSVTLTPTRAVSDARFVLLAHAQGGLALDMVSLFPHDTFKGRANGLRRDLAQTIAELHPKFMRFPGGCLVHGANLSRFTHGVKRANANRVRFYVFEIIAVEMGFSRTISK